MTMQRGIRFALPALATVAMALVAVISSGVGAAGATLYDAPCTAPPLLRGLCPPTTPPTSPPTTKAPVTTTPPTTARPATTAPSKSTTAVTSSAHATSARPSVGATGIPAPATIPGNLGAFGIGSDPLAPQLAGTASPSTTLASTTPIVLPGSAVSGLVGSTQGFPSSHSKLRLALSILAVAVAGIALGQLPARRRTPLPATDDAAV